MSGYCCWDGSTVMSAVRHTCLLQVASKPSRKKASLTSPPAGDDDDKDDDDDDNSNSNSISSNNNNEEVQTDSTIPNNMLDIIIHDNEK